jgi:hypothetical protein
MIDEEPARERNGARRTIDTELARVSDTEPVA